MCPFVADDEAIGMGGTIAKYVSDGKSIIKVVFSYGESSHPHFKEEVVIKNRVDETQAAADFIGIKKTTFLGMKDTKVTEEINKKGLEIVTDIIKRYNPEKIFIPSAQDPHPDHQAVNRAVLHAVDIMKKDYHVFAYEVWNVIKEQHPFIYVDVTKYFNKKLNYIKMFKSQWQYMYVLWLPAYARAIAYGMKADCRFAERFYKLR